MTGGNKTVQPKRMELYVHIPFCVKKCEYCDFLSFPCAEDDTQRRYVEKLIQEIVKMGYRYRKYTVSTIFVGGGTPSLIDSGLIVEIFDALRENFHIEPEAEITLEANPGTLTEQKLADYRRAGINRLSIGLQSTDESELKLLGRIHTYAEFLESYRMARAAGFENINVDLISGLPGQTEESWLKTLRAVTELEPEHISAYSLIIEEGTPFYEKYGDEAVNPAYPPIPDEDTDRRIYHLTKDVLKSCGYERYEISNYARPGYECRHNIGYWTNMPYLGLGLGASSYMEGRRFTDLESFEEYMSAPAGRHRNVRKLTEKDMWEEFFYVGLRMIRGVSLTEFEKRFGFFPARAFPGVMERFIRDGAAELVHGYFRLTDYGLDVSNYVLAHFLLEKEEFPSCRN